MRQDRLEPWDRHGDNELASRTSEDPKNAYALCEAGGSQFNTLGPGVKRPRRCPDDGQEKGRRRSRRWGSATRAIVREAALSESVRNEEVVVAKADE